MVYNEKAWEVGKTVHYKGYWESHLKNVHLLVTLWTVTQDFSLHDGVLINLRSLQATWSDKIDTLGAIDRTKPSVKVGHISSSR